MCEYLTRTSARTDYREPDTGVVQRAFQGLAIARRQEDPEGTGRNQEYMEDPPLYTDKLRGSHSYDYRASVRIFAELPQHLDFKGYRQFVHRNKAQGMHEPGVPDAAEHGYVRDRCAQSRFYERTHFYTVFVRISADSGRFQAIRKDQ